MGCMKRFPLLSGVVVVMAACGGEAETPLAVEPATLSRVCEADAEGAAQGYAAFADGELFQGVLPTLAMRNLYITWTDDLGSLYTYYTDADAYWEAFNTRYGTIPSAFPDAVYPSGFGVAANGQVGVDCLMCHAGRLEGETVIGMSNNRLDLRGLVEDLQRLPEAIAALKMRDLPAPYDALIAAIPDTMAPEPYASIEIFTGAAGVNDGFGLGFVTAAEYREPPAGMRTFMGYQEAPIWWTIPYKERLYSDGSANAHGVYTMMSTLLAFGLSYSELASYLPTFDAIRLYQCSLEAPKWADYGLGAIDAELVAQGAGVFAERCASCHGSYDGGAFPNMIVPPADIGTDPLRVDQFGPVEAAYFNDFIPEERYEMTATGGYLAPALTAVWASAPYFHNGSVPTLRALLDPASRPVRWRRSGEAIDPIDVGLTYEVVDAPSDRDTIEGRKVVDTTLEGMSNGGHDMTLDGGEIDALLAYLTTL